MKRIEEWAVELWDESHVCNGLARGAAFRFVQRVRDEALEEAADVVEESDDGAPLLGMADAIRALKGKR